MSSLISSHCRRTLRALSWWALLPFVTLATPRNAAAQNPDLTLSQEERDSILKDYHNIFPFLGRKAIERGFDLPKPVGLNVLGLYMNQGIEITDLGLSTGANPIAPIDFIGFGTNTSTVYSANLRLDLWVLPFLNVYGFGGRAQANTKVEVSTPIAFTSEVDQPGNYAGVGLTGAMGLKRNFIAADINWSWSDFEKLDEPVFGRVFSARFGRTIKLGGPKRASFWVGTMNQKFRSETNGSILLSEAIPPEVVNKIRNALQNVQNQPWYMNLTPPQKALVDQIVNALLSSNPGNTTINYQLKKDPADPWNMLVGGNIDLNKRWTIRAEVGFIGRTSVLLNAVYRLDL
ncbi:MAG TPA: hypothetical protein VH438_05015 [Gemmatimonadales bacterium]|jgi:hypothetical protein